MIPLAPILIAGAKTGAMAAGGQLASNAGKALMSTITSFAKSNTSVTSLADLTRPARVEPLVLVDQVLLDQPIMIPVMKLAASSFAAYYLQAVNMVLGVGRIDTLKVLDSLNPERNLMGMNALNSATSYAKRLSNESIYSNGLPSLEAFVQPAQDRLLFSKEAFDEATAPPAPIPGQPRSDKDKGDKPKEKEEEKKGMSGMASDAKIFEVDNLIVGKLLNVEIKSDGQEGKLPVLIRMVPAAVPSSSLVHMFSAGGRDSWAHRRFMVKTGQIKFWRDYVFGMDMIDEHFKALMQDKSGVFKEINNRRRANMAAAAHTGNVSLADASNIAIISSDTIKKATGQLLGKIEDAAVRRTIFDNTYLLMLIIVDERWQRVQVWHRGLDMGTTHRFEEVERSEKAKGPDITDMFKLIGRNMQTNIN